MSRVTVFESNVNAFMQRNAFSVGGSTISGAGGRANRIGNLMVAAARANASGGVVKRRTSDLANSVVRIGPRPTPRGGIEIGVGTTVKHGAYLEVGTDPHPITVQGGGLLALVGRTPYVLRSGGPRDRPPGFQNPRPLHGAVAVQHPGNKATHWLSDAVTAVTGRRPRVTTRGV